MSRRRRWMLSGSGARSRLTGELVAEFNIGVILITHNPAGGETCNPCRGDVGNIAESGRSIR